MSPKKNLRGESVNFRTVFSFTNLYQEGKLAAPLLPNYGATQGAFLRYR